MSESSVKNNMKLNKLGLSILLTGSILGSGFAMEMMASDTMMHNMKATGTMMVKKEMMTKCIDEKKATRMEIKKFQKENNLDQAGVIGKKTKAKLEMLGCKKEMKTEMMDMKKDTMMKKMDDKMMKASDTMMHN